MAVDGATPGHGLTPLVLSVMTSPDAPFVERVEAAAAAGYPGIGLRPGDRRRAHADGLDDHELRAILRDHAVEVVEIDVLVGWGLDEAAASKARAHEERIHELVDALGGHHLTVTGDLVGPFDRTVELFAGVCDRAAEHGLRVALEFLPWTEVPDAASAYRIVEAAGRANGGVLVDSWHHFRGANDEAQLLAIPPEKVVAVQIDDAGPPTDAAPLEQTFDRLVPGEGVFDLDRFVALLVDHGVHAPLCVEVISPRLAAMPIAEAAKVTADATRRLLDRLTR